jgi:hypothetical protein
MIPAAKVIVQMGAVMLLIDTPYVRRPGGIRANKAMTVQDKREQIPFIVYLPCGFNLPPGWRIA